MDSIFMENETVCDNCIAAATNIFIFSTLGQKIVIIYSVLLKNYVE